MPELPEVETTRLKIEPLLKGRLILGVVHDAPHKYRNTDWAVGRRVLGLSRRGKYLLLLLGPLAAEGTGVADDAHDVDDTHDVNDTDVTDTAETPDGAVHELEFIVHLGMTGGFRLQPGKHTRVTLETDAGTLHFDDSRRFGKMAVVRPGEYAGMPTLAGMGPEPLSDDFQEDAFVRLAATCGAVKPWLLSQKPVSGVGNIYADESLWMAQIHPAQTHLTAVEARRLYQAIREVMAAAVAAGGSTLGDGTYQQHDGVSGLFQHEHNAYARDGHPCPRCGTNIQKTVLAQRGTHYCPKCQKVRTQKKGLSGIVGTREALSFARIVERGS